MIEMESRVGKSIVRMGALPPTTDPATAVRRSLDGLDLRRWKLALIEEFDRSSVRERLPVALAGLACIHLLIFSLCQASYVPDGRANLWHPVLWLAELIGVLACWRGLLGRDWARTSVAMNLVVKFWTTFLILSFSVVMSNSLTGFELAWYKPVWGTLSTFLFASMAWLFTPWFFVPAVQMGLTGLLIVRLPDHAFTIYGVSWWLALVGIALRIHHRNRRKALTGRG